MMVSFIVSVMMLLQAFLMILKEVKILVTTDDCYK